MWPTVWPGARIAWIPGRNSSPSLMKTIRSRLGVRFLRAVSRKDLELRGDFGFVGPEIVVGLRDVVLRVGEMAGAVVGHAPAAMIDMRMAHHHGVDVLGIDPRLFQAVEELAGRRAENRQAAHAGVEQHEPVAGVEHESILLEDRVLQRQEVLRQLPVHFLLGQAGEVRVRIAERQRTVGDDRCLGAAELEAIEIRRLGVEHRRLGERRSEKPKAPTAAVPVKTWRRERDIADGLIMGRLLAVSVWGHGSTMDFNRRTTTQQ